MEKTVKFSIIKEKIIKTDELLQLHLEKTKELDKTQKCYKQLRAKLDLTCSEIKKLKLKNDALTYSFQSAEKKSVSLQEDNKRLKQQLTQLEKESSDSINNLQINYQQASLELQECKEKLDNLDKQLEKQEEPLDNIETSPSKKKKSVGRSRKRLSSKSEEEPSVKHLKSPENTNIYQDYIELKAEKDKIHNLNANLQLEVYKLKKQIKDLQVLKETIDCMKDIETTLHKKEDELNDCKHKLKTAQEEKVNEISKLLEQLKNLEAINKKTAEENKQLKNEISSYQLEITAVSDNNNMNVVEPNNHLDDENQFSPPEDAQHREETPTDKEIEDILKDLRPPTRLSPLESLSGEDASKAPLDLPDKISCLPLLTNDKQVSSSSGDFTISSYSDITKIRKRKIKKRKVTKKSKKIDLLKTLLALKKANINFVLSSDSHNQNRVPPIQNIVSPRFLDNDYHSVYNKSNVVPIPDIKKNTFVCNLYCDLECCKNSHMLLKGGTGENAPLLGFFDVKNETSAINTRSSKHSCPKAIPYRISSSVKISDESRKLSNRRSSNNKQINLENNIGDEIEIVTLPVESVDLSKPDRAVKSGSEKGIALSKTDRVANDGWERKTRNMACADKRLKSICTRQKKLAKLSSNSCVTRSKDSLQDNATLPGKKRIAHTQRKVENSDGVIKSGHDNGNTKESDELVTNKLINGTEVNTKKNLNKRIAHLQKKINTVSKSSTNDKLSEQMVSEVNYFENSDNTNDKMEESDKPVKDTNDNVKKNPKPPIISVKPKSPKRTFRRPLCSIRRSPRFVAPTNNVEETTDVNTQNLVQDDGSNDPPKCPQSPTLENRTIVCGITPKVIPLDRIDEEVKQMPKSKIDMYFNKLVLYSKEEEALNEVAGAFYEQDPEYIAEAILEKISGDFHDTPDNNYLPAPVMTDTQRIMLGFMSKLEKTGLVGICNSFLTLAEQKLLTCPVLQEIAPITRLYLAICKLNNNLCRMRKLCCDIFYFCGDFAVPFLFFVLTSWTEVLPHAINSKDMPLARVLVQIVYMKDCNKPGYNLLPLRDLLIKFFGYPSERWDSSELFQELLHNYLRNPVRSTDFALLLFCKNQPEKWVHDKIEQELKPVIEKIQTENFKASVIILIGNLYNRFSSKSNPNYLPEARKWFESLVNDTTSDVIRRSVYLCLNRLNKCKN